MTYFFEATSHWLHRWIQSYIDKKVVVNETWELEQVEHKDVKLPYVVLENRSQIINQFFIPIHIEQIRLNIWNKQVMVGRVLFEGPVKIKAKSKKTIPMEVRLSHITAIFNLLRYILTDKVPMELKGEITIKVLWMSFSIQVNDTIYVPRDKFKMASAPAGEPDKKTISNNNK